MVGNTKQQKMLIFRIWNNDNDNGRTICLVYSEPLSTINTVDSTSKGITMRMINFGGKNNDYLTRNEDGSGTHIEIGGKYGDGSITKNLLKTKLEDNGYPVTADGNTNLSALFEGGQSVNHLFSESVYNATGNFEYSSFKNYAYLNSNGDFTVYDQIGTPLDVKKKFYQRGNFFPYK